jgi:hypothetical protein
MSRNTIVDLHLKSSSDCMENNKLVEIQLVLEIPHLSCIANVLHLSYSQKLATGTYTDSVELEL